MTWRDEAVWQVSRAIADARADGDGEAEAAVGAAARTLRQHRDDFLRVVATELYGEGSYPFNAATGLHVRMEVEGIVDAVLALLGEREASEPRQAIADEQNAYIERQREREASDG